MAGTLSPAEQLRRLDKLSPDVFWFYPTTLRALLHAAGGSIAGIIRPRLLISSSEMLADDLDGQLRDEFGSSPLQWYGCIETGRIGAQCPARRGLHIQLDSVVLESWAGDRAARVGEAGSAVVTTLHNRTMPFIRYRLGDLVELSAESCSCGSNFPMIGKLLGREGDVVRLADGRVLASFVLAYSLRNLPGIDQFRITQETLDRFTVVLASRRPWAEHEIDGVRLSIRQALSGNVEVEVRIVESLPVEPGKFRAFISKLSD
ncbi:MAG: hypothetical protein ACRD44_01210 [Bryobacteraceae bacterium]